MVQGTGRWLRGRDDGEDEMMRFMAEKKVRVDECG